VVTTDEAVALAVEGNARRRVEHGPTRARRHRTAPRIAHPRGDPPAAAHQLDVMVARHAELPAVLRLVVRMRYRRLRERRISPERQPAQEHAGGKRRSRAGDRHAGRRATSTVTATMTSAGT
jgi:hypothetical protein